MVAEAYVIGTAIPAPNAMDNGIYADATTSGAAAAVTIKTMVRNRMELRSNPVETSGFPCLVSDVFTDIG